MNRKTSARCLDGSVLIILGLRREGGPVGLASLRRIRYLARDREIALAVEGIMDFAWTFLYIVKCSEVGSPLDQFVEALRDL